MSTTLIRGGTVITATETLDADVLITGSTIAEILPRDGRPTPETDRVIDASGRLVLPGGVDVHTHMELETSGTRSSDTFWTGTRAAAWGGTTTIVDFATQEKGESLLQAFEDRLAAAEGQCAIDYSLHAIVSDVHDQTLSEMRDLVDEGCTSFKLFMAYPGVLYSDDGQLFRAMQVAAESASMIMLHAENGLVIDVLREQAVARGETDPVHHVLTRPPVTEAEAVHRAIAYADLAGAPLYIVHMSAKEAAAEVATARAEGKAVFGETCPQYLYLTQSLLEADGFEGAKYVCSTPLRNQEDHDALWAALGDDTLQVVSTDHCGFCFDEHPTLGVQKRLGEEDFRKIPNGLPTVEDRMRLLLHGVLAHDRFGLNRLVDVACTAPAKLFGLYPRKGTIAPGSDADVLIVDPNAVTTITAEHHHMDVDYSCFEGMEARGAIEMVLSKGQVIVDAEGFHGAPGDGEYLRRTQPLL